MSGGTMRGLAAIALISLSACAVAMGGDMDTLPASADDAGIPDAGHGNQLRHDGGGIPPAEDAGIAETDAGAPIDPGTHFDAGTHVDAGTRSDAGAPTDGGKPPPPVDAGMPPPACVPTRTDCNPALECGQIPNGCPG